MPVPALKNIAKKHGISISSAEKKWDEAKNIVSKQYDKDSPAYWGTVMKIIKAKIKKHGKKSKKSKKESRIYDFQTFLNEGRKEKLEINKEIKKKNREEQLKSGADLRTKVIPDKKKQYKRNKKVDLNKEIKKEE
jgi:hypothetical protein